MKKLNREFYNRDSISVAKDLLGKVIVHEINGYKLTAKIVEVEAYMGVEDKAAHSYGGRRTKRVEVMYGAPGFSYVYLIYGMYHCFNIVTNVEGTPQAVLIRAVEPLDGLEALTPLDKSIHILYHNCINIHSTDGIVCFFVRKEKLVIIIDYKDRRPIYEQIVERFQELILKGDRKSVV